MPPLRFLRFAALVDQTKRSCSFPQLTIVEEQLLNYVGARTFSNDNPHVMDLLHALPSESPTTLHRRLKSLRLKGYLHLFTLPDDQRCKEVRLTNQALSYFDVLGKCLHEALASAPCNRSARVIASAE